MGKSKVISPESLLRIPLIRKCLSDTYLTWYVRPIDSNWVYQQAVPHPITGFNPYLQGIFISQNSHFSDWLSAPQISAREFNPNDRLVKEALFVVHDYLHCWSLRAIQLLRPNLNFGFSNCSVKSLDQLAALHLITETAAVVGLDYWYLSRSEINKICPIGTITKNLAVAIQKSDLKEFRRFNPSFNFLKRSFFTKLFQFYCSGEFLGFDSSDLKKSPTLLTWLGHELRYGKNQRGYARAWMSALRAAENNHTKDLSKNKYATKSASYDETEIPTNDDLLSLCEEISFHLWNLVNSGEDAISDRWFKAIAKGNMNKYREQVWQTEGSKELDYRWTLEQSFKSFNQKSKTWNPQEFDSWFYENLSRHKLSSYRYSDLNPIREIVFHQSSRLAKNLFNKLETLRAINSLNFDRRFLKGEVSFETMKDVFLLP